MSAKTTHPLPLQLLEHGMAAAIYAARRWVGATSPNPPVGAAALAADGRILAVTAHHHAGQPHAEALLLKILRERNLLEATHTVCVTLEPCTHQGRTPPCTSAIIASGIQHIAIGISDPNPHVSGGGIGVLQQAGIMVSSDVLAASCAQLTCAFTTSVTRGRPWLTIKRALTATARMIPPAGQTTFTSAASLTMAHQWRKRADVIMTGSGTILADEPRFTVRHVPDYPDKHRILAIMDSRRRVSAAYLAHARQHGFIPIIYDDVAIAIADLHQRGCREILLEAGVALTAAILAMDCWDMLVTIQQAAIAQAPDIVTVAYQPATATLYPTAAWRWEDMLPV